jgi:hypothetical protein
VPQRKLLSSMNWQSAAPAPALVVHPPAAANLDEAHAAIEQWEHYSRKLLDGAQRLAVEHMMAIKHEGTWAARTTGRAESRQNGKGDEIEVVEAWDLTQRGAPVVHTAHEIPTAKAAHLRLVAHLHSHRDLRRLVKQVRYANGDQSIETINGGIVVYRTRTNGGGRGLDDIARLVVDEAQHAQPEQLASSTPILAVNPNPQTNFMGSAGIDGRSAQWWTLRKRALDPDGGDFAYLEHSAEQVSMVAGQVVSVRPDPSDVEAWITANPAFPERIPPGFLAEQLKMLGPELFSREHLCVWDPADGDVPSLFGTEKWARCAVPHSDKPPTKGMAVGVAVSMDRAWSSISAAVPLPDRNLVGVLARRRGTAWVVAEVARIQETYGCDVIVDKRGPAADLIEPMRGAGVVVVEASTTDVLDACASFYDKVQNATIAHMSHPELEAAVSGAQKRAVGERWAVGRRLSMNDVSPLEAAILADWSISVRVGPLIFT